MSIEVRSPGERYLTTSEGRTTWHSFSFGEHYDPHNVAFGALLAHNEELLPAGTGYAEHAHREIEILTLVIAGALAHQGAVGGSRVLGAGELQVLNAGTGTTHEEYADPSAAEPTRFVQLWLRPDEAELDAAYSHGRVIPAPDAWICIASGEDPAPADALELHVRGAAVYFGALNQDAALTLPDAPRVHVFVISGAVTIGDRLLGGGATARLIDQGPRRLRGTEPATQLLVCALP